MKRDLHINQLQEVDYSFALNTNTEQETGEGLNLTNEPSNYLAVNFPEGYKVIGKRKYLQGNKTFYILTNPETKKSSIGYVDDTLIESFNNDEYTQCTDCEGKNNLSTPLEELTQTPTHQYVEIVNDECHEIGEGFDLDINHPIKFLNLKVEKGDVKLYWNDFKNPPRWINTTNTTYLFTREVACDDDIIENCIIVDKLLQFPKYGSFKINPNTLQTGGNLKKGTYEFYGAYCDIYGNNISEFFVPTNPIPIFDENDNILSQKDLDSYTNFSIKLNIENLNTNYPYYKIVCIERTDVSGTSSAFLEGIHPTTDNVVIYSSSGSSDTEGTIISGNKKISKRVDISDLYEIKTKYDKAKGTASINGRQFMWGLNKKTELNLQPAVNLFGSLIQWQTSLAKEDLYKNPIACSKYKGYNRNEVQPFALRYWFKDGGYTANFPLIGRPALIGEKDIINTENPNRKSIDVNAPECTTTERQEKWQYLNTATQVGICEVGENIETQTVEETIQRSCTIESVATIVAGGTIIEIDNNFVDLENYINSNFDEVTDDSSDFYIEEIAPFLLDEYEEDNCDDIEGLFQGECEEPVLQSSEVYIGEVENEQYTLIEKCTDDYVKTVPPQYCNIYERNLTNGGFVRDTDFASNYMPCGTDVLETPPCIELVYKRDFNFYNENCDYAETVTNNNIPNQQGTSYFHNYYGGDDVPSLLDPDGRQVIYTDSDFQSTLHKGALFFKIEKNNRDKIIFEITKKSDCKKSDDIPIGNTLRYNFYSSCNSTEPLDITIVEPEGTTEQPCGYVPPTEGVVDMTEGLLIELDISGYPDTFYVAIDAPIVSEEVPANRGIDIVSCECDTYTTKYRTAPICGCFGVYTRDIEYSFAEVSWDSITIDKKQTYTSTCTFEIPIIGECDPVPYAYGEFSYNESTELYPDNRELYDSSNLKITEDDLQELSSEDKARFETYYTLGIQNELYRLRPTTDFRCANIRHPKFPDNTISPFMSTSEMAPFSESLIYPLGIKFDSSIARTILNVALSNSLITQEDYDNIQGFEILKADNSTSKSVIANGLIYDMYEYTKGNNKHYYANYPFNDLGKDSLHYQNENRTNLIPHPYNSEKNNRYSFLSPDIFLTKPALPTEMLFNGYLTGTGTGRFVDVEEHPKWTILGREGRTLADLLATVESALELIIKISEFTIQGQGQLWVVGGVSTGSNAPGVGISTGATALYIGAAFASQFLKAGQYRYQWLQIFRDLGTVYNFAGYNVAHGHHNRFIKNNKIFNEDNSEGNNEYLRGLSLRKYMKDGRYEYRDNNDTNTSGINNKLFINNWGREESVFLSTGDFPLHYNDQYINYDNSDISPEQGSRTTMSDNSCDTNITYERNVGSPYVSLKNYVPDQYGSLESIKWLTTNSMFNIDENTSCKPIYGGTVFISRFTWKRKLPLFTTTAMGEPDKLAFNYSQYANIGTPRFYCDYETDSIENVFGVPFPDIDSNYEMDCTKGRNDFYLKPPSKFYLYYYGITDFLVESEINCNYRYGKQGLEEGFYPSIGDMVRWTQEKNVPISEPNRFYYNNTYSLSVSNTPYKILDTSFSKERQELLSNQENATIWSEKDQDENSPVDPWLIFKPLNWYEFNSDYGKLIELKSIEQGQVLARFEDKQLILNAVDNLADRMLPQTQDLGTGGIFSTRPIESNTTDLGFIGSQHHQTLSTPYGHITVDAKRGKVHLTNSQSQEVISEMVGGQPTYMKNWFREHLPFNILKKFPNVDIDNNYKGLGITMGWDARHDRVFITKKDLIPKNENIIECGGVLYDGNEENYSDIISEYEGQGFTFEGIEECRLKFKKQTEIVTNSTDIYAIFDTSSMEESDGENAAEALQSWYTQYQINNPTFTGNLYIIPLLTSREEYLLHPYLMFTGEFETLSTVGWDAIAQLPPNIGTLEWQPPYNLLLLSFVDEARPSYHNVLVSDGFGGGIPQPTARFISDYQQFLQTYPFYNSFQGVLYPIVQNIVGQGGSLVLQAIASFEGKLLTQAEIDAYNTNVDIGILLTENAYYNAPIPSTTPQEYLEPLKDYNWKVIADKEVPSENVFSSQQFQNELNSFVETQVEVETEISFEPLNEINLSGNDFEDASWTIAFKIGEGWISYHSFLPNYYSFHNDFFQVGYNYGDFAETLWSHTLNNTSFQVFQGVKYPWVVEVPLKNQNANKILKSIEINVEGERYQNQWEYSQNNSIGFNKMVVYNNTNNSGNLNLVHQKSYIDVNRYPITNSNGTQDILYTSENGKHYVNYFYNRVKNQNNNIPNWLFNKTMTEKTVNPQAVSFKGKPLLERMKGQQFIVRLIQDKESRYSIILKDIQTKEIIEP